MRNCVPLEALPSWCMMLYNILWNLHSNFILESLETLTLRIILSSLNMSTFDPALEKAVLYAVGNTLVCDILEEAKSLAWGQERYKGVFHCFHCFHCLLSIMISTLIWLLFRWMQWSPLMGFYFQNLAQWLEALVVEWKLVLRSGMIEQLKVFLGLVCMFSITIDVYCDYKTVTHSSLLSSRKGG